MTCIRILNLFLKAKVEFDGIVRWSISAPSNIDKKGFEINRSDISEEIGYKKIGSTVDWNSDKNQNMKWYF